MSNYEKLKTFEPLPSNVTIKKSRIHGLGLFSTKDIPKESDLGITHVKDNRFSHGYIRTPLGGFLNHSRNPNCKATYQGDFINILTITDINSGEEITVNYLKHDWIKETDE